MLGGKYRSRRIPVSWVLFLAAAVGIAGQALDPQPGPPYFKTFVQGDLRVEAGFFLDRPEYVWGEPIYYITYLVRNIGDKPFTFLEGGDYRGGRSESYRISAVDAAGQNVAVPEMYNMGGKANTRRLGPGQVFRKMLPVERRLTFTGPGIFTVTGSHTLMLGEDFGKPPTPFATATSFTLRILPYKKERMQAEAKRLATGIRAAGETEPKGFEFTEPNDCTPANRQWLDLATLTGIKDEAAVNALLAMAKDATPTLRSAVLERLGNLPAGASLPVVLTALRDADPRIRAAAATGLGRIKSDAAVDALLAAAGSEIPQVSGAILRALGSSRSPRALDVLRRSLKQPDARHAAVDGLVAFGGSDAVMALRACAEEPDMDFREHIVETLAEKLHQPIDPYWLVPVIRSREGSSSLGRAPDLMRMYGGAKALPALLGCLDYGDPSTRTGGMKIPWASDLNREGTPTEIDRNLRTLRAIKAWVADYKSRRMNEPNLPHLFRGPETKLLCGATIDDLSVCATTNQQVWPAGMTQLLQFQLLRPSVDMPIELSAAPEALEIELNGEWYTRHPLQTEATPNVPDGYGSSFGNILLDDHWRRKSDGQPLALQPGRYSARVGVSLKPEADRTVLAISKPFEFEIMSEEK